MYHYGPLQQRLEEVSGASTILSYGEIETVLGRRLPPSARGAHKRQFWANTLSHSQAKAWMSVGMRAKLIEGERVEFQKSSSDSAETAGVTMRLDLLGAPARRAIADMCEENNLSADVAAAALLDRYAIEQRRSRLAWFQDNTRASAVSSAELIRADRDAR